MHSRTLQPPQLSVSFHRLISLPLFLDQGEIIMDIVCLLVLLVFLVLGMFLVFAIIKDHESRLWDSNSCTELGTLIAWLSDDKRYMDRC